jgi:hypothetical protein
MNRLSLQFHSVPNIAGQQSYPRAQPYQSARLNDFTVYKSNSFSKQSEAVTPSSPSQTTRRPSTNRF